jgi:UDP-N-acetylmuramoyl-L-alanyl-D-glutamate--2,6-diaminopimelate ligase
LKSLGEFLPIDTGVEIKGSVENKVKAFQFDSRKIEKGIAFVAMKGTQLDGHDFIDSAIALGCEVVICERFPSVISEKVTYVKCESVTDYLGKLLPAFFDLDLDDLVLIGVTGTNGKTTVATLLYQLFGLSGFRCGLISTVENRIVDEVVSATHTTPDQIRLFELLSQMQKKHCSHVFMEVSSHALDQNRVRGLNFKVGIFTNITHDHLDYHKTFKAYIDAKKRLFDTLSKDSYAIVNIDDKHGLVMIQNSRAVKCTFALNQMADHRGKILENSITGLHVKFDETEWHSRLIGEFNAYNLLAVYSCTQCLGMAKQDAFEALSMLKPPEGRFDWIRNDKTNKIGIVDYAHTPDALEKILQSIKAIKTKSQKIITVVGCGGNRDKSKRPVMASVASTLSDKVILTSDNPRNENPSDILTEMENGISQDKKEMYLVIEDRTQAIKTACMISEYSDIILVAGKGHEKYQEIKGQKLPFDDMKILKQFLLN